jgi:hypothetical protein
MSKTHDRHVKITWRSRFVCVIVVSSIGHGARHNPKGISMAKDSNAVWSELNPDTLAPEMAKAYAEYKELYRMMKAQRQAFETMVSNAAQLPKGKRVVFGYNFGKLSVAIVEDDRKPAKATPAKQSLADFIASQAQAGRRV